MCQGSLVYLHTLTGDMDVQSNRIWKRLRRRPMPCALVSRFADVILSRGSTPSGYPTRLFNMPPWLLRRLSMEQPGETTCVHVCTTRPRCDPTHRKKERTTALVVSAVLHGFRAIDTGRLHDCLICGCKPCSFFTP